MPVTFTKLEADFAAASVFDWQADVAYHQATPEALGNGSNLTLTGRFLRGKVNDEAAIAVNFPLNATVLTGQAHRIILAFNKPVTSAGCLVSALVTEGATDFTLTVQAWNAAGAELTPFGASVIVRASAIPDDPALAPRFAGLISTSRNLAKVEYRINRLPGRPPLSSLVLGPLRYVTRIV